VQGSPNVFANGAGGGPAYGGPAATSVTEQATQSGAVGGST
jgi:hypothetical protein